jgi:hypothetical protein
MHVPSKTGGQRTDEPALSGYPCELRLRIEPNRSLRHSLDTKEGGAAIAIESISKMAFRTAEFFSVVRGRRLKNQKKFHPK